MGQVVLYMNTKGGQHIWWEQQERAHRHTAPTRRRAARSRAKRRSGALRASEGRTTSGAVSTTRGTCTMKAAHRAASVAASTANASTRPPTTLPHTHHLRGKSAPGQRAVTRLTVALRESVQQVA